MLSVLLVLLLLPLLFCADVESDAANDSASVNTTTAASTIMRNKTICVVALGVLECVVICVTVQCMYCVLFMYVC